MVADLMMINRMAAKVRGIFRARGAGVDLLNLYMSYKIVGRCICCKVIFC